MTLELQDLLERPLSGPEGDAWKRLPREMPEHYEQWVDAQLYSEMASNKCANFEDIIYPLEKTKNRQVLENMWKYINLVGVLTCVTNVSLLTFDARHISKDYEAVSGADIDTLWQLYDVRQRTPQWHSVYIPELGNDSSDDSDSPLGLIPLKPGRRKQLPAITSGATEDSDSSMPDLQSASDSSEDDAEDSNKDITDNDDDGDDEGGYNTEEEDEMRDMLRAAMDAALEADLFDSSNVVPETDLFTEERKGNPFLKLLGSLKGWFVTIRVAVFHSCSCQVACSHQARSLRQNIAPNLEAHNLRLVHPQRVPRRELQRPQYKVPFVPTVSFILRLFDWRSLYLIYISGRSDIVQSQNNGGGS
jgi:hypothetical protein